MNTNRQIIIDNKILRWVALLLNILVSIAGKIAPKNHDLSRPFKKIGISKFKGLGSIVQATPLLQTLKLRYPDATIVFVSTTANKALLEEIELVDEVVLLNDKGLLHLLGAFLPFIGKLFRHRFDVYIDLEVYSNFASIVAALTNAQNRFGFYQKESSYKMGIYTHMMYYNTAAPIYQTYLQWARLLGCSEIATNLYRFNAKCERIAIDGAPYLLTGRNYIVVNANASDLRVERRWPAASFSALMEQITSAFPETDILLVGSGGERDYVSRLAPDDKRVKNIAGTTTVAELIAVISHAHLVITNDTGPMHLAFAAGTKTVALFGPCAPSQYGNYDTACIIYKNVYCSPCVHEFRIPPCQGNNQCMKQISVSQVMEAVMRLMSGGDVTGGQNEARKYTSNDADYDVLGMVRRKTL